MMTKDELARGAWIPDTIERRYCPTDPFHWRVDEPNGRCPVCKAKIRVVVYERKDRAA